MIFENTNFPKQTKLNKASENLFTFNIEKSENSILNS